MTKCGKWFRKHESPSGEAAPFRDSSLQRSHLTDGEVIGALTTEALEEFFGRSIGFGLKPGHHERPRRLERILASAPVPRRLGSCAMRGANFAVSPGVRQTLQKAIEIRIAVREHVDAFACCESGEMMLDCSNFIEKSQGVERAEYRSQPILHRFGDRRGGQ
jgi:hypothetical protein